MTVIAVSVAVAVEGNAASKKTASEKVARELESAIGADSSKMEKIGETFSGYLERHRHSDVIVSLEEKRCYRFFAAAGPGSPDISLALSAANREVASDRLSGTRPFVRWCAPSAVQASVRVSMYDGEGTYVLMVFAERPSGAPSTRTVNAPVSDFAANRVGQLHARFSKGKAAVTPLITGNLHEGEQFTYSVALKGGRCYAIFAAGDASVRVLKLVVRDGAGTSISETPARNSFPMIDTGLCPTDTATFSVSVEMVSGAGPFAFRVFGD